VACELYRQSVYWALLAHRDPPPEGTPTLHELFASAHPELLARPKVKAALTEIGEGMVETSFVRLAELEQKALRREAASLGELSSALLEPFVARVDQAERRFVRRVSALAGVVLLTVIAIVLVREVSRWRDRQTDLAAGKAWTASSRFSEGGCGPRQQSCEESPHFFFCTEEQDRPSLVIDLGKVTSISSVVVENRRDCCGERPVPLVLQLSQDQERWRRIARRDQPFSTWRAEFPSIRARFVKLYVARKSFLHLSRVRVMP
jgi:hypothetical protein